MTKQTETKLVEDVTKIKQAVLGNGVKGLCKAVEEQSIWIASHPQQCPHVLKRRDVFKVRALEISLIAVILTIGQILLRIFGVI